MLADAPSGDGDAASKGNVEAGASTLTWNDNPIMKKSSTSIDRRSSASAIIQSSESGRRPANAITTKRSKSVMIKSLKSRNNLTPLAGSMFDIPSPVSNSNRHVSPYCVAVYILFLMLNALLIVLGLCYAFGNCTFNEVEY